MSELKTTAISVFTDTDSFDNAQRMVAPLAASDMVPQTYRGNIPNCMIALEMANRIQMSPLMVMQNLNIIHGRQSWGSSFIIALINSCGRFTPLRFKYTGTGDDRACRAYAKAREDQEVIEGPEVSIKMAKDQGWWTKSGSKWPSMPELMLSYRSAAFFGRLYCPDVLMGLPTDTEIVDIGETELYKSDNSAIQNINNQVDPPPAPVTDFAETTHFEEVKEEETPPPPPPPAEVKAAEDIEVVAEEVLQTPPPPPPPVNMAEDDDF